MLDIFYIKRRRLDAKYLQKNLILKSTATTWLVKYAGSEIFALAISRSKHHITFIATLSLYKSGTIFRTRLISNQWGEPVLRSRYAPQKTVIQQYLL